MNTNKMIPLGVPDIGDAERIELVSWYVNVGDHVLEGQEICELVTEKAAFPLESPHPGQIMELKKAAGSQVNVGEQLATLKIETETAGQSG